MSTVYFIRALSSGHIKIGISKRPTARTASFGTSIPGGVEVLGFAEGGERVEMALHAELKGYRINGEWFEDAPIVRAVIDRTIAEVGHIFADDSRTSGSDKFTVQAAAWTQTIVRNQARRKEERIQSVRGDVAQEIGITTGLLYNLCYGRTASISAKDFELVRIAFIRDIGREIDDFLSEAKRIREFISDLPMGASSDAASVRRLEAVIAEASTLLSEMTGGVK